VTDANLKRLDRRYGLDSSRNRGPEVRSFLFVGRWSASTMTDEPCDKDSLTRANADGLLVSDAMIAPKTTPGDATVGDLRALFANHHVLTALLVDGPRFVGVVQRDGLPDGDDQRPARDLAVRDVPAVGPDTPLTEALARLDRMDERRLVVLDHEGDHLCGLLCLTTDRNGFCQS
jgi:CBS-domain-containing membrane protein